MAGIRNIPWSVINLNFTKKGLEIVPFLLVLHIYIFILNNLIKVTKGFVRNAKEFGKDISRLIKTVQEDESGADDDPF